MRDPHYVDDLVTVYHGDCLEVLAELPDASVDAVVTDPPYGLGFMGKAWDADFEPGDSPMRRSAQLDAADYLGLITQRLTKPIAPVLDLGEWSA